MPVDPQWATRDEDENSQSTRGPAQRQHFLYRKCWRPCLQEKRESCDGPCSLFRVDCGANHRSTSSTLQRIQEKEGCLGRAGGLISEGNGKRAMPT